MVLGPYSIFLDLQKSPKVMAQYPNIESIGSIGSIILGILWRSIFLDSTVLGAISSHSGTNWRGAAFGTTILYIEPSISFHVNFGEGTGSPNYGHNMWDLR